MKHQKIQASERQAEIAQKLAEFRQRSQLHPPDTKSGQCGQIGSHT